MGAHAQAEIETKHTWGSTKITALLLQESTQTVYLVNQTKL